MIILRLRRSNWEKFRFSGQHSEPFRGSAAACPGDDGSFFFVDLSRYICYIYLSGRFLLKRPFVI